MRWLGRVGGADTELLVYSSASAAIALYSLAMFGAVSAQGRYGSAYRSALTERKRRVNGFCPRCGKPDPQFHPRVECDAYYDVAYEAAKKRAMGQSAAGGDDG